MPTENYNYTGPEKGPEDDEPETLHDRATLLQAHISGAKEELAEYVEKFKAEKPGFEPGGDLFDKLANTIRSMQGPAIGDLLTRIHVLETSEREAEQQIGKLASRCAQVEANNADLAGALGAAEKERDSLRQLAAEQGQRIATMTEKLDYHATHAAGVEASTELVTQLRHENECLREHIAAQDAQLAQFYASGAAERVTGTTWDRIQTASLQAAHDKLIGHYRAVLHDLSAPQQPAPEAARDGMDAAYLKANPLMAGGAPLGA